MPRPAIFTLSGYTAYDPLDGWKPWPRFVLLAAVNLLLTAGLLLFVSKQGIASFNGFDFLGLHFSNKVTIGLEFFMNGIIFPLLIVSLRKSSSLLHYLIVFVPYFLLELYIESHFRATGQPERALWNYGDIPLIPTNMAPVLTFFLTVSIDAIMFGIIGLYIARLIALLKKPVHLQQPVKEQYQSLFGTSWSQDDVARPHRDVGFWVLRLLGVGYMLYLFILLIGTLGASPWPAKVQYLIRMTYDDNPALAINTYFKIILMIMLAFVAAYNKGLRFYAASALFAGHFISTAFALAFYFSKHADTANRDFLLISAETDGPLIIAFLVIMLVYKKDSKPFAPENDLPIQFSVPLTLMRNLFTILFVLFTLGTIAILFYRILGSGERGLSAIYSSPDPLLGNTLTLYGTLSLLFFLMIKRERLRTHLYNAVLFPFAGSSVVALLWLIISSSSNGVQVHTRGDHYISADGYLVSFACVNIIICLVLLSMRRMYYRVDYAVNTLNPSGAVCCMAMANALFDADDKQQAFILHAADQYAGGITGRKRGLLNLPFSLFENVLSFVYGFHPAFSSMSREEQRWFLRRYFLRNDWERRRAWIPYLAEFAFQIGSTLNSLVMFANYSYLNARHTIGYVPADARDRTQADTPAYPPPHKSIALLPRNETDELNYKPQPTPQKRLIAPRVTTPFMEDDIPDEVDYLVIGSGAGGATMAYRLACTVPNPGRILVLERGNRYQPLQDFGDGEIDMMRKVYKEGGLQQTRRFTMTVLQGECVGGTTVINNAVCFRMPDHIKADWQRDYGLDLSGLDAEYERIAKELNIHPLDDIGVNQVVKEKFTKGVCGYNKTVPPGDQLQLEKHNVLVNHYNNTGDGNWNLGNKRMRKRSMLETYIPWAEARGVKVVSNMTAVRFITEPDRPSRASHVIVRSDNGSVRRVKVKHAVVVAGGVISSSHFLLRSEVPNDNIGKRMSCNFAFPVTFDFEHELKAYDGDQITMAALDPKNRAAFETYFNPPASFALSSVPFFFDKREHMMRRYRHLVNFGALIGSEPNGVVQRKADLLNGMAFNWELGEQDIANIKYALTTLVHLGKAAGSTTAWLPTKPGIELILSDSNINSFIKSFNNYPLRMKDLYIGTAHPQGGNLCSAKNGIRVTDENGRVDGYENVFVADASLFPTSLTVNPQWTIMAMSSLVAKNVVGV